MNRIYYRTVLAIMLVMAAALFSGSLRPTVVSAALNQEPQIAAPTLINHAASSSAIKNKWNTVKQAQGYEVYKATKANGKFKLVKTLKSGKTVSWTEKKLKENKFYFYKVRAYGYMQGKKVYSNFSSVQSAAPTDHPNWEYSISSKSEKTKKAVLTLTNKSRDNMVFYAEGLYLKDSAALKEWNKLETGQWKDLSKSKLKAKGLIPVKGKKVTIKPGKTAKLVYKASASFKYTKTGRLMSEFRYDGSTYGVFHSGKYPSTIWVY